LSVSCEVGGPYLKNSSANLSINVVGNVTSPSSAANITVNITKEGVIKTNKNTAADSDGVYYVTINQSLDVGNYTINVSADQGGAYVFCNDSLEVRMASLSACTDKNLKITGKTVYSSSGGFISSGKVFASILDENINNNTSFTNGDFTIYISGCLKLGKRYILQLIVEDNTGSRSWLFSAITW
jgi:hypothetical protein